RLFQILEHRNVVVVRIAIRRHILLFSMLSPCHMSGDETDGDVKQHPPVFRIILARWQSVAMRAFLWKLDAIYRADWAAPSVIRTTPGNPPRHRVFNQHSRVVEGRAPVGLCRNCYDAEWLQSLRPHIRDALQVIDKDYDFTLPDIPAPSHSGF
ncbi:uncharacterized protein BXZ73DRAFT_59520, partial [Epithele typhae]|uniref:uncharacterized protein n=1 Tax=Epithele typhae TaxID=378194 RepID=UPI0020073EF3